MAEQPSLIAPAQRSAARVAGLAFLISFAFVVYANFGLRSHLFVTGDIAETVRRIAAAEPLFRLSVAFELVYCIGVIVLLSALYVVLGPVNRLMALMATFWKLAYAVTAMLMALSSLNIAHLTSDPVYAQAFRAEPLQALVKLNSSATWDQYYVGLAFWALSSTVIAWLWLESRYVPAALATFGLVSSAWCAICTFTYIINPAFSRVVNLWWFDTPMVLFDITLSFWLLFRGLRAPPSLVAASDP